MEQTSPVIIRGVDLLGQPFEERTAAQNLSFHGCRYASKHHLPKNTWITLEVPSGESRGDAACVRARVAWIQRPQTLRDLFQVGIELEKGRNVWGVTPPTDWHSGAGVTTMTASASAAIAETSSEKTEGGGSLEVYLQMALAHTRRDFMTAAEEPGSAEAENVLLAQLREEFAAESQRMIAEARAVVEEVAQQSADELRGDLEIQQDRSAEALHQKWVEEFERGKGEAKAEIVSALAEDVAAQLAAFQEQVREALTSEWAEKLSRAKVERPDWQAELQTLREEVRATSQMNDKRSEERWHEKLREIRREWEASPAASVTAEVPAEAVESAKARLFSEADTARAQWNELLESSLDRAAQRLNERLSAGSQDLLHRTEQDLAKRLAELQKESGLTTEISRAALADLKAALETEVSRAKVALGEVEQVAGRFSEYSRQLEAASQDSLNELRQRLESSVARECAGLDRYAAELEGKFSNRAGDLLERMRRETVERSAEEIAAKTASGIERATRAADELATREEQAEGILRIHRERLRQVSEQMQKEGAAQFTSALASLGKDMESLRAQALVQWKTDLEANGMRARENASEALAKETAKQLVEADAQLLVQAQQAVDSAAERMGKRVHIIAGKFRGELDEMEASQIGVAREHLDSAKNEFTRAAEKAASTFGEVIAETSDSALRDFSAASEAKAEEGRARLVAAAENALEGVQSQAESSFEHFQGQLASRTEEALKSASETLDLRFEGVLEKFRRQSEERLADWSRKQESLSEQALEAHNKRLREASHSWMEATLERLDEKSEERIDAAVCATESAVRRACADVFDSVAQAMKKQVQGALELRPAMPSGETGSPEQRASA